MFSPKWPFFPESCEKRIFVTGASVESLSSKIWHKRYIMRDSKCGWCCNTVTVQLPYVKKGVLPLISRMQQQPLVCPLLLPFHSILIKGTPTAPRSVIALLSHVLYQCFYQWSVSSALFSFLPASNTIQREPGNTPVSATVLTSTSCQKVHLTYIYVIGTQRLDFTWRIYTSMAPCELKGQCNLTF